MTAYNHIQKFLQGIPSPVIFELGVHWAEDTQRLCKLNPNYKLYHGFEPDDRNFAIAANNIRSFNQEGKIHLHKAAVSNKDGISEFYQSFGKHPTNGIEMTGANSILEPDYVKERHRWIKFKKFDGHVNAITLDTFCKAHKIGRIDLLWSDIQGAEYLMIEGARKTLKNTKLLMLEYSNENLYKGQRNLKKMLELLGEIAHFTVIEKYRIDVLLVNNSIK